VVVVTDEPFLPGSESPSVSAPGNDTTAPEAAEEGRQDALQYPANGTRPAGYGPPTACLTRVPG